MHYQVQEMLRAERISRHGIQEELDAYNPLIPDGSELDHLWRWNIRTRRSEENQLLGVEKHIWGRSPDFTRVTPIADEDLERVRPQTRPLRCIFHRTDARNRRRR